jgi:hypothetical protein
MPELTMQAAETIDHLRERLAAAESEAKLNRAKYEGALGAIPVVVAKETARLKEEVASLRERMGAHVEDWKRAAFIREENASKYPDAPSCVESVAFGRGLARAASIVEAELRAPSSPADDATRTVATTNAPAAPSAPPAAAGAAGPECPTSPTGRHEDDNGPFFFRCRHCGLTEDFGGGT